MESRYRAYVKDVLNLTDTPKVFLSIISGDIAGDILTSSSSSFTCLEDIPEEVNEGDVLCVYDYTGKVIYTGVISSKGEKDINTDQIYSIFNEDWFMRVFKEDHLEHEIADVFNDFFSGAICDIVSTLPTANEENYVKNKTYLQLSDTKYNQYRISKALASGSKEEYVYTRDKVGEIDASPAPAIIDTLVAQKYGAFTVTYDDSQEVHLTAEDSVENSFRNMEDFIYELYEKYGVVIEITIPYSGSCSFHIKTPSYTGTKVAKNSANILSIVPTTETEETNRLVIMSSTGAYRKTYYATKNGIVDDSTDPNRLPVVNTAFVYSDADLEDIKTENLKDEMYNHEIKFEMFMHNNIYDFYSWKLGQPLEVYYKGAYYNSIFTGYSYSFSSGETVSTVEIVCGKVRNKLTDLINMKKT